MNFLKDLSIDKIQNLAEDAYNTAKPKTEVEARVYEVLSHKNWGASGSLMNEIARDTYDMERFQVVSGLMWDGMENQRPSAWKVVFKALNLLDHLVKNGAERCVDDARNHGHILRSLGQFNYYEGTIDRGLGVREKSKQVLEMLSDDDRVREERQKARKLREKFGKFNAGSSGIGGGGSGAGNSSGGYGNQDSWKNSSGGGGYGEGGIYDNDRATGRYGKSDTATPTFASMPGEKKKKKKKKKPAAEKVEPAAEPAPPVEDLLGFDAPAPAPAAATGGSSEFGAFQATSAPTPAAATDDFAAFDQIRSKASSGPDPFASAPAAQPAAFDAFGNNNAGAVSNNMMNNNMMSNNNTMNNNGMMNNNNMMNNNMAAMGNAFNNMSVGIQQPAMPAASNDDDFGDFETAKKTSVPAIVNKASDPMAGLINLDGLAKNPSKKMSMNQPVNPDAAAAQFQQDVQNGVQNGGQQFGQQQAPGVVSAGGSDAISSMMGPQSGGMPMNPQMQNQQQQQFNMKQGMPNQGMQGGMNNMMGMNQMGGGMGMQGGMNQMGGMQGGMQGGMNQMGGMQGGMMNNTNMNQMGMNQMGGGMGMQGGMNQMGGMQGGMNQMGGMQGGMNQMGGQMMGNMGGMQGGMGNMGMQGGMGGQQSFR